MLLGNKENREKKNIEKKEKEMQICLFSQLQSNKSKYIQSKVDGQEMDI